MNNTNDGSGFIFIIIIIYLLPFWIALYRKHHYRWVILALTIGGGWTGFLWLASLVWSVWPNNKSLADPVIGNVTGEGERNIGHTLGEIDYGREQSYEAKKSDTSNEK